MTKLIGAGTSLIIVGLLSACTHTSQFTSGRAYLGKYEHPAYSAQTDIDSDVREIAAIEPRLDFPARIGLARIENAQLTSIPSDEAQTWQSLTEDLGGAYGEFVPVSPLIAAMVARPGATDAHPAKRVVDDIRRGSARQHLDYVLIYEVTQQSGQTSNALRLTDLSILGLYIMPSREVKIDATASAMFIDVRNGYPYGSATAFAERSKTVSVAGRKSAKVDMAETSRVQAVENLSHDVYDLMEDLIRASEPMSELVNMAERGGNVSIVAKNGTKRH